MIKEFKDFIMKGNVLELAVAVIIAGAFGSVITTFTNDVLMPPIGMALGGANFDDLKWVLQPSIMRVDDVASHGVEGLKSFGEKTPEIAILYGKWINTIINFLIIAFILFLIIRGYNKANAPEVVEEAPAGPSDNDLLSEIRDLLKK